MRTLEVIEMKPYKLSGVIVVVAAILVCLGFAAPAKATDYSTFTCTLTEANAYSPNTSPNPCTTTADRTLSNGSTARNVLSGEGYWNFEYTVVGNVSFLGIQIKNNPGAGDICFVYSDRLSKTKHTNVAFSTNPIVIEAAATSACGTQYTDTNGPPLTLFAYIQTGDPNASVTLDVHYPSCLATNTSGNCTTENGFALNGTALQQGALARLREQGGTFAQLPDPVVDVCRRRVLLG